MRKTWILYGLILLAFGSGVFLIFEAGKYVSPDQITLEQGKSPSIQSGAPQSQPDADVSTGKAHEHLTNPVSVLLLQMIVILIAARIVGAVFRKLGQPSVLGEMTAGIMLGPSLFGWLSPDTMVFLFPPSAMEPLRLLGQVGIILFMFSVGMDLDLQRLRQRAHAVVLVSHTSIILPFFLGCLLSLFIYRSFAPAQVSFSAFGLFIGVAMSITAFPVLARIIEERGLSHSHLGHSALACAAVDDATAWCLLAGVVAIVKAHGMNSALLTFGLLIVYVVAMFVFLRPQVGRFPFELLREESRRKAIVAGLLIYLFASSLLTEVIGVHALFGAFVAGLVLPSNAHLRTFVGERLETFTASLLLPLFFAFTGLRTQIGLLNDWSSWLVCLAIIAVAITGKLGGSMFAARWTGMSWHESVSLGVLMNTRGLIELIVLNIGYDLGILSPKVFSMMVLMALVTTFMAGPILNLIASWEPERFGFLGGERGSTSLVNPDSSSV